MKNLIYKSLFILLAICALSSCKKEDVTFTHFAFKESESDDWGLISCDGKILFADEFKNEPTAVFNGRFFVKNSDNMWELYTADEKPQQIDGEFEQACSFTDVVTPVVRKGSKTIEIIDLEGNTVFKFTKAAGKKVVNVCPFFEGIAVFKTEDECYGCVDTKGNVVIKPNYSSMSQKFYRGRIVAVHKKYKDTKKKVEVLDKDGNTICSLDGTKYECVPVVSSDGSWIIMNDKGCGIMNMKGEITTKPNSMFKEIYALDYNSIIFNDGEKCGVMHTDGNTIIRPKYESMFIMASDIYGAKKDDKCFLVNEAGEKIGSNKFKDILTKFTNGAAIVKTDSHQYSFIDKSGEVIKGTPELYDIEINSADAYVEIRDESVVLEPDTTDTWDVDSVAVDSIAEY